MSNINRRAYLKSLAVGAVGLAASRLDVFAQERRRIRPEEIRVGEESELQTIDPFSEYFINWPGVGTRGADPPPVLVTYDGLVDFFYNTSGANAGTCGVGFQRTNTHHQPMVEVFEDNRRWFGPVTIGNPEVVLKVMAGTTEKPIDVKFLKTANKSPEDFRWTIDMQSRSWYQNTLLKPNGNYSARLFMRNGVFFTRERTLCKLDQAVKIETLGLSFLRTAVLGNIARIIATAIPLTGTEYVVLKVNGQEKRFDNTKKYRVEFKNMCHGGACTFDSKHFEEAKRNDFHHHRDALDLPDFSLKYSVVLAPGECESNPTGGSDAAPCMGAGYSGGNGPS